MMDNELDKLEAELSALRPVEPPKRLEAAIAARIDGGEVIVRGPWFARPLAAAAMIAIAAVGVFFAILNNFSPDPAASREVALPGDTSPPRPTYVAVRAENVFEGARDEGIILSKDNVPMRQLRYQFTDSLFLQNPDDGSELRLTLPREQFFLVPVDTD